MIKQNLNKLYQGGKVYLRGNDMEYFGDTSKLSKILSNPRLRTKAFGRNRSKRIGQRLSDFEEAATLDDISYLPPARLHQLHGNRENQFAVDVGTNWRMIFEGYDQHDELTTTTTHIVTIVILEIEDYH